MRTAIQTIAIIAIVCLTACLTPAQWQAEIEQAMEHHLSELKKHDKQIRDLLEEEMPVKSAIHNVTAKKHAESLIYYMAYYYDAFGETPKIKEIEKEFNNLVKELKRKEDNQ